VICPACQVENVPQNKFCGECGARLPAACAACGHPNPAGQKFCGECGAPLAVAKAPVAPAPAPAVAPAPPAASVPPPSAAPAEVRPDQVPAAAGPPPVASPGAGFREAAPASYTPKHLAEKILTSKSAVEGERKTVTVMFSDVSGFTAMSERLDPEDVHGIMDRAFGVILEAVHRHEGTINQFLGDGVMALFGAPIAHEDHAQRALSAALSIQEGLKPLAEEIQRTHGIEFRMRMGINTGPVVVGAIGRDLRMDYTAVGDTTNLAARLLAIARPGQIVASRATQHLRARSFLFEDLGDFQVKGKSEPVRAYAVIGEVHGRVGLEASPERALTPLIGRERELARLQEVLGCALGGQGAIVMLSGEPGVGKSRLLYEFLTHLAGTGVHEIETTCASYGRSIPYRPVLDLVRALLDLPETTPAGELRQRLAEQLEGMDLAGEERVTLLAHFLGVSAPPEFVTRLSAGELKDRTLGILRDLFLRASRAAPLLLLVENVHWMDASSADFIGSLAGGLGGHRILVLLSTRPDSVPWANAPAMETISVDRLADPDVDRMARALLAADHVSPALLQLLAEKSEGNPLYVEEILHQLKETGGVLVEDGEARLRSAEVKVPATIHDIIAARVDRLAEPLKLTLRGASVVGRRFGTSLLSRVIEEPAVAVGGNLKELHAVDFVFPSGPEPEPMFSFKHALTQDVVYTSLLDRRRRRYHAAVGAGLEELYADRLDEVVELLAYHYGASAEDEKAVDYALLAAEKAQRRWANVEALAQFEAALARLGSMPATPPNQIRRIDAVIKQAEVKFALGRHAEHVAALEGIKDLVDTVADPPRRATWYYWTGFLQSLVGGHPEKPIAYCREALAIADASGFDEIRPYAECCLAHVLMAAGDLRGAIDVGERALATFEARGNIWWACRALWALSPVANYLGEWERGLEYCRRALDHGRTVNDLRLKVVGWWRTGSTHIQRGDPGPGLRCCDEALALSPIAFDAAMVRAVRAYGLVKAGQVAAGTAELTEAVAWFARSQLHYTGSLFTLWLIEGHLALGQRALALAALETVLATTRENGYRHLEGVAERLLGEALDPGDPAALEHLDRAGRILEEVGARNDAAKVLLARARHHRATGDLPAARAALEQARAIFASLGTIDGPQLVAALIESLADTVESPDGRPASR
jgi:class 3 adenylate cyclase/tetratricopeptide (TPR) repeat protein